MKSSSPPTFRGIGPLPRQLLVERVGPRSWQVSDSAARATIAALEVIRLDGSRWRISDSTVNEHDSRWLLGYVERLEHDRYEVLWLAAPVTWAFVASFEDALAAVADRTQVSGAIQPQPDPAIAAPTIAAPAIATPATLASSLLAFDRIHRRQTASTTAH